MTNVEALKALYAALGGDPADVAEVTVTADVISAMATLISGGALVELPAVTALNNGQVLTVVSGKWAAAALPAENTPAG